jgi:predicted O-methyltransferase YrrM
MPCDPSKAIAYLESLLSPGPEALAFGEERVGGHVQPDVGPLAAGLLDLLTRALRPTRILEIGTGLGYSACVLGRAAREYGGMVQTIEIDEQIHAVAKANVAAAGLAGTVEVILGDAKQVLARLPDPFGVILQDGAKEDYLPMLAPLVDRLAPGGILVTDDVLFPVMDLPAPVDHWGRVVAAYNEALRDSTQLKTVWLPIGDGIALSLKIARRERRG